MMRSGCWRGGVLAGVLALGLGAPGAHHAWAQGSGPQAEEPENVSSGDIFGFAEGSDTGEAGEREVSLEAESGIGKRRGDFAATGLTGEFTYAATNALEIAFQAALGFIYIEDVPGLEDESGLEGGGLGFAFKYRAVERGPSPVGVAFVVEPGVGFAAGQESFGAETKLVLDTELLPQRLFAAINLIYAPEIGDTGEGTERSSSFEAAFALAARFTEDLFLGAELRYLTDYEGLFFREFAGEALFAGPTLSYALSERAYVQAAWSVQVAGEAEGEPDRDLDLTNYERHQAKLKLGYSF